MLWVRFALTQAGRLPLAMDTPESLPADQSISMERDFVVSRMIDFIQAAREVRNCILDSGERPG